MIQRYAWYVMKAIEMSGSRYRISGINGILLMLGGTIGLVVLSICANSPAMAAQPASPASKATTREKLKPFLDRHCVDCHDSETQEGELNLAALQFDPADVAKRDRWITIFDRVRSGEMPPKDERRPDPVQLAKFLATLSTSLDASFDVSHPQVSGGHNAEGRVLSAAPLSRSAASSRNSISLDQLMAKRLGSHTRFPSLVLNCSDSNSSPSYTENGAMIPAESSASRLFARLFVDDAAGVKKQKAARMRHGRSIMDVVAADAKSLQPTLGNGDRIKLDSYFTSVNELEKRMAASEQWINRPKPKVDQPMSISQASADAILQLRAMLDIMSLALQTDSSRFITLHLGNGKNVDLEGVREGHHALSHHGRDEGRLEQLAILENAIIGGWADSVRGLKKTNEASSPLLDRTMVLLTSNLGNASSHDNRNMPVLFAGGGFRHGQHLAFNRADNYPLPNLYLSTLHRLGLDENRFATSTSTMTGLKMT